MDTKIRCHACGALGRSTTVCIKKGRNAWRMSSLGNREVGTRPIVRGCACRCNAPTRNCETSKVNVLVSLLNDV